MTVLESRLLICIYVPILGKSSRCDTWKHLQCIRTYVPEVSCYSFACDKTSSCWSRMIACFAMFTKHVEVCDCSSKTSRYCHTDVTTSLFCYGGCLRIFRCKNVTGAAKWDLYVLCDAILSKDVNIIHKPWNMVCLSYWSGDSVAHVDRSHDNHAHVLYYCTEALQCTLNTHFIFYSDSFMYVQICTAFLKI